MFKSNKIDFVWALNCIIEAILLLERKKKFKYLA